MSDADRIGPTAVEPKANIGADFAVALADLRRALVQAIAGRAGKAVEPISLQEAYSDIPLADLYHRSVYTNHWFAEVFDRLLFRWWRPQ